MKIVSSFVPLETVYVVKQLAIRLYITLQHKPIWNAEMQIVGNENRF